MKLFSIFWILFVLQSVVSIQHPTLAIWQWISGALILSYQGKPSNKIQLHSLDSEKNFKFARVLASIVFSLFLFLVPSSLFKDYNFAQAIRQRNGEALIGIALSFPSDTYKSNYSARAFQDNGYWYWANQIAKESVMSNPRNLEGWVIILENKLSSRNEKREASVKINELNLHQKFP